MSETIADFVVVGSSPLARLLAGLLSGTHGRRVIHVGQTRSAYRLARQIDLSIAPITRPESWALLGEGVTETLRLIGRIAGRSAWSHVDPIFFSDAQRSVEALSHIRHMALGFGIAAEPTAPSLLGQGRTGITLRDAVHLNRPILEPALEEWLPQVGVQRLAPEEFIIEEDGSAALKADNTIYRARQTILADDDAIVSHLTHGHWPGLLRRHDAAAILTTAPEALATPVMQDIHSGIILLQQQEGAIAAIGPGDLAHVSGRISRLLGEKREIEQAGQTSFVSLATSDGAPAVGRLGSTGADIVAGMGMTGIFLVPALARWLSNAALPQEAAWFGERLVSRTSGGAVTEYAPVTGSTPA